jgi:hypothetical protein
MLGTGSYLPATEVDNRAGRRPYGVTEEWIVRKTGIHRRWYAAPDEATSDLAVHAARAALAASGIAASRWPPRLACSPDRAIRLRLGNQLTAPQHGDTGACVDRRRSRRRRPRQHAGRSRSKMRQFSAHETCRSLSASEDSYTPTVFAGRLVMGGEVTVTLVLRPDWTVRTMDGVADMSDSLQR